MATKPIAFEVNVGQTDSQVKALARGFDYGLFLTSNQVVLTLARPTASAPDNKLYRPENRADQAPPRFRDVVAVSFVGANPNPRIVPEEPLTQRTNYFIGSTSITNVPNYSRIRVENLYAGIDVEYYGDRQGRLEYDLIVSPGADLNQIRMEFSGATATALDEKGNLALTTQGTSATLMAPVLYQRDAAGRPEPVTGHFKKSNDGAIGFETGAFDPLRPLVIDPVIEYATLVGGSYADYAMGIAVDGNGSACIVGVTASTNFPIMQPFQGAINEDQDLFVTKLNPQGTDVVYSTYLGGSGQYAGETLLDADTGSAIAVDAAGNAYITGASNSLDYPTTSGAYQNSHSSGGAGNTDVIVTKLSATGDALLYSTFIGGSEGDGGFGIAVNARGEAFVTGDAGDEFPTTAGAYQTDYAGEGDAFLAKLNATGSDLVYCSYLGPLGTEVAYSVAVDPDDNAYVAGQVWFIDEFSVSVYSAFAAKFDSNGSALAYWILLNSTGMDYGYGIAVDREGFAYVTGYTYGDDFPTTGGAFQETTSDTDGDVFVTKISQDGSSLVYSSYLGGSGNDFAFGITLTDDGKALVVGVTQSEDFPLEDDVQSSLNNVNYADAFATEFTADGSGLIFSTYLGGTIADEGKGVALDLLGDIYVCGGSTSYDFVSSLDPVNVPFQDNMHGVEDAFVLKINGVNGYLPPPVIVDETDDTGYLDTDNITMDGTPILHGTAPADSTVKLFQQGVYIGDAAADGGGDWDYQLDTLAEGTYAYTAYAVLGNLTSRFSNTFVLVVDQTPPEVKLTVPEESFSFAPLIEVRATDNVGIPPPPYSVVSFDVDLNEDHDFDDYGEEDYANGIMENGYLSMLLPLPGIGTYDIQARITDIAGNEGVTAEVSTVEVVVVPTPWEVIDSYILISELSEGQELEQLGAARVVHALDLDISPGSIQSGSPAFYYNSNLTHVRPIVQATLQTDNAEVLPAYITVTLIWDGNEQTPASFSTSGITPGDMVTLAVQVDEPVTETGRYGWTMVIGIPGLDDIPASNSEFIRVEDESPFGAGWTFSPVNRLIDIEEDDNGPAGKLWLYPSGEVRFFSGTSTFISPAEENGDLEASGGGFLYTAARGWTITFDSEGYETEWLSVDEKESIEFSYTDGLLTGMIAIDSAETEFTYSSGLIASIDTAGGRSWSFDFTDTDLTQITDPDNRTRAFGYNGNDDMVSDDRGSYLSNGWDYRASEVVETAHWGSTSTGVESANTRGLIDLWIGPLSAVTTGPYGKTEFKLDKKARALKQIDGIGGVTVWNRDGFGRVSDVKDAILRTTSFTRNGDGYVTEQLNPDATTRNWTYDGWNYITQFTDENGHSTDYTYDGGEHLLTITDAESNETVNTYNSTTGLQETSTDPMSRVTYFTYDGYRRNDSVTDVLGETTFTFASTTGEIESITDALSRATGMTYDDMGRMIERETPDSYIETWEYNDSGLLETHTNKESVVDKTYYDSGRGLPIVFAEAVGTPVARTTLTSYDGAGRAVAWRDALGFWSSVTLNCVGHVLASTDKGGAVTRYRNDLVGQRLASIDALGFTTGFTRNIRGWVTTTTDPLGHDWDTDYDNIGLVVGTTDPESNTTATGYNNVNQVESTTDKAGNTNAFSYWGDGRGKDVTDGNGITTRTTYDLENYKIVTTQALGETNERDLTQGIDGVANVISFKDGLDHEWDNDIDEMDRVEAWTDPLNHGDTNTFTPQGYISRIVSALSGQTDFTLDALGRAFRTEDATGVVTVDGWDAEDQHVSQVDATGAATKSVFDGMGRLTASIDARGGKTLFGYDKLGQLISYADPIGNITRWEYDGNGNKIKETDPRGNEKVWTYNAANYLTSFTDRLLRERTYTTYGDGKIHTETWSSPSNTREFIYDGNNNLTEVSDNAGTIEFVYDELNRVTSYSGVHGGVDIVYDAGDRIDTVTDSEGGEWTYLSDDANRVTSREFDDGSTQLSEEYDYNAGNQVTQIDRYDDSPTLVGRTLYGHDAAGRIESITHKDGALDVLDAFTYAWDNAGRLEEESSILGPTKNYTYFPDGEIKSDGADTWDWDANGNNKDYTVEPRNEISTDGDWNYTYDDEGNLTDKENIGSGELWHYGYDWDNRLVLAEHQEDSESAVDLRFEYEYDALNNRTQQSVDADGDGVNAAVITKFAYDLYGNAWADFTSGGSLITRRLYEDAVDALYGRIDAGSGDVAYYLTDMLGSVRDMADAAGAALNHRDWSSFGVEVNSTGTDTDRYGWTGREFETEMQMQYNRARWYDPQTARWISQDPMGFDAGDSNLYRYVRNGPTNTTDPSGFQDRQMGGNDSWGKTGPQVLKSTPLPDKGKAPNVGEPLQYSPVPAKLFAPPEAWQLKNTPALQQEQDDNRRFMEVFPLTAPVVIIFYGGGAGISHGVDQGTKILKGDFEGAGKSQLAFNLGAGREVFSLLKFGNPLFLTLDQAANIGGGNGIVDGAIKGLDPVAGNRGAKVAAAGTEIIVLVATAGIANAPKRPQQYSVYYEAQLSWEQLGLRSDQHMRAASAQLRAAMVADAEFAASMESLIPGLTEALASQTLPKSMTWHHALTSQSSNGQIGAMHLVTLADHKSKTFAIAFHPKGFGGYKEWAIPAGAPKR